MITFCIENPIPMIFILGLAELNVTSESQTEANVTKAEDTTVSSAENVTVPETAKREVV